MIIWYLVLIIVYWVKLVFLPLEIQEHLKHYILEGVLQNLIKTSIKIVPELEGSSRAGSQLDSQVSRLFPNRFKIIGQSRKYTIKSFVFF